MWFWWEAWMANEYLDNLAARDMLKVEAPSTDEVSGLVRSGAARLEDAKNDSLSLESRFDLAYNAAHASSLAALRIAGYRSNDRCLVFQCLDPGDGESGVAGVEGRRDRVIGSSCDCSKNFLNSF